MQKTGYFRAKPDPGKILFGKKLSPKNFLRFIDFKNKVFEKPDF